MKTFYTLLFSLFLFSQSLFSQVIPANRTVDWSVAGLYDEIEEPANVIDIINYGAAADGTTDDQPIVVSAINSLNGNAGVIYFPAGTYLFNSGISLPSNVIIRGAGSDQTFIKLNHSSIGFNVGGGFDGSYMPVINGLQKGSTQIEVGEEEHDFSAGDFAEIRQENGSWDVNPVSYAENSVGQVVRIAAVQGDTLVLENEIRIDYDQNLLPEIRKVIPKKNVSIECLNIERVDGNTNGTGYNISFSLAANCSVRGIESDKSQGSHLMINRATNIEVTGSYFHHAYEYNGSGTKGYGVTINNHAGENLIENNIFKHLRHAMMTKHGANGNVFAYNYSIEPNRSETFNDFSGDISLHGHYSFANLFEGNIVQNIIIDHYWGPSGPGNTFVRNRAEAYGIILTPDNNYNTQTNAQNFVGNEVTKTNDEPTTASLLSFAYTLYYGLTGSNHFEHGNNVDGQIEPAGTGTLQDDSYYLENEPGFWTVADNFPSIGVPNNLDEGTIPAKQRFLNQDYTVCGEPVITAVNTTASQTDFTVFPNPAVDRLNITWNDANNQPANLIITTIDGKVLKQRSILSSEKGRLRLDLDEIPAGVYLLSLQGENFTRQAKFVKR